MKFFENHLALLWVRPPPCENMCVRSLGYIVGASPPLQYLDSILNWIFNPILNPILKPNIDCPLPNKCFPLHPKKLFTPQKFTCSGRIFRVAVSLCKTTNTNGFGKIWQGIQSSLLFLLLYVHNHEFSILHKKS